MRAGSGGGGGSASGRNAVAGAATLSPESGDSGAAAGSGARAAAGAATLSPERGDSGSATGDPGAGPSTGGAGPSTASRNAPRVGADVATRGGRGRAGVRGAGGAGGGGAELPEDDGDDAPTGVSSFDSGNARAVGVADSGERRGAASGVDAADSDESKVRRTDSRKLDSSGVGRGGGDGARCRSAVAASGVARARAADAPWCRRRVSGTLSRATARTVGMWSAPGRRFSWTASPRRSPSTSAQGCLLYTSPSPRDKRQSRMPSSA